MMLHISLGGTRWNDLFNPRKVRPFTGVDKVLSQYFANMAFRRTRWIQETFVCTKFPAEFGA